jgi:hypothetical protein
MRRLKFCTWNIEHFQRLLDGWDIPKLRAISDEIRGVNADVLCIVEGRSRGGSPLQPRHRFAMSSLS